MITLTSPIQIASVLGSGTKLSYDRLDVVSLNYDVVGQTINGTCRLVSSGNAAATPIGGSFFISSGGNLTVNVAQLPFTTSVNLTSPQIAAVQGWITSAQNSVEAGLVSVGVIAGTQANGL